MSRQRRRRRNVDVNLSISSSFFSSLTGSRRSSPPGTEQPRHPGRTCPQRQNHPKKKKRTESARAGAAPRARRRRRRPSLPELARSNPAETKPPRGFAVFDFYVCDKRTMRSIREYSLKENRNWNGAAEELGKGGVFFSMARFLDWTCHLKREREGVAPSPIFLLSLSFSLSYRHGAEEGTHIVRAHRGDHHSKGTSFFPR